MKIGDKVNIKYFGTGVIISREADEGILSERFIVKLDFVPGSFKEMHKKQGGLAFHESEFIKYDE